MNVNESKRLGRIAIFHLLNDRGYPCEIKHPGNVSEKSDQVFTGGKNQNSIHALQWQNDSLSFISHF